MEKACISPAVKGDGSTTAGSPAGTSDSPDSGVADDVQEKMFGKMTITERFGEYDGLVRQQKIFATYQIGDLKTIPWFIDGARTIIRHPKNQRKQASVNQRCFQACAIRKRDPQR